MDVSQPSSFGTGAPAGPGPVLDPRLQPTPDYGTLGPGSDISKFGSAPKQGRRAPSSPATSLIAIIIGMFVALFFGAMGNAHQGFPSLAHLFSGKQNQPVTAKDMGQLDRMGPQRQAETLLELAVRQNAGAPEQISSRVDHWPGKVHWNSQIASLSTAALNSNNMRVRESGVEVELAAYGLAKNAASLDYLLKTADSSDHARKIWALWALGLMGNRGVQTDVVLQTLTAHLKDSDADTRRWVVESLALVGSNETIEPLLKTMHDDPSPLVRERAACSLAESGMLTPEQRLTAVPQLLNYTDDASLDAQTHGWAFQALHDITHQNLPNDSAAWRNWYETTRNN